MSSLTISTSSTFIIFFFLCLITNGLAADFHVKRYGARANGNSDDSQAIMRAWKDACMSRKASKVVISGGRYVVNSMKFKGPCMAPIHIQMEGRLEAPLNIQHMKSDDNWIIFEYINALTISGKGIFDGRGSLAWKQNQCASSGKCDSLPIIPSRVAISDVGFRNIVGTSTTRVAVKLVCSRGYPCKNVKLSNINLRYIGTNGTAISECSNVKPTISGRVMPPPCTRAFAI
ncbi:Exopolygalacturonase, partial [Cucurbita argyrosperma subsp. sororia]